MGRPSKALFDDVINCPKCSARIHVKAQKETITPAQPAETELNITVELEQQTTLKTVASKTAESKQPELPSRKVKRPRVPTTFARGGRK
jgi:DNA-directed RNA polymerase subunit RPC12/RpoP